MENQLDKRQEKLISAFHTMWDAFPGMARLINQKHEILASNELAQKKGFVPGAICAQVASPQAHKGCLLAKTIQTGEAQYDQPNEHLLRGWMPVLDHEGVVVHFSINIL
ncbi:MAG: hypothetical protein J1E06_00245 [Acutalibacter sp.]|nr:hypothetical protein [Acutalibacter sp.]